MVPETEPTNAGLGSRWRQSPDGCPSSAGVCRAFSSASAGSLAWREGLVGRPSVFGLEFVCELRQLREENGKLKRLVADLSLDRHVLQEIVRKKL